MTETPSGTDTRETQGVQGVQETRDSQAVSDAELPESSARGRARIRAHAARLFNNGLAAARDGRPAAARDHFAACVLWYPHDLEARSALALACLESGDRAAAGEHWRQVLDQRPNDRTARRGLALLEVPEPAADPTGTPAPAPAPVSPTVTDP